MDKTTHYALTFKLDQSMGARQIYQPILTEKEYSEIAGTTYDKIFSKFKKLRKYISIIYFLLIFSLALLIIVQNFDNIGFVINSILNYTDEYLFSKPTNFE